MRIRPGDSILVDDVPHIVMAIRGRLTVLMDCSTGTTVELQSSDLFRECTVTVESEPRVSAAADVAALAYLPPRVRAEAYQWAVRLRALDRAMDGGALTRAAAVEQALERLAREGHPVDARTLQRKRRAFREQGVLGLVDKRVSNAGPRLTDPRVVAALAQVIEGQQEVSSGSKARLVFQVRGLLDEAHGPGVVQMPSDRTMMRLIGEHRFGDASVGSARSRQTRANQPDREFSSLTATRPGELVEIDSTVMDVMVRVGGNIARRPELTLLIDTVTRTILAAVMRLEGTKSVDLVVLLARALVPYETRPGADAGAPRAAAMRQVPYIFPETITSDRGKIFVSEHFTAACEQLGISLNLAAPYTATDKAKVERTFRSINSEFTEYVKGYTGRSVEYRGAAEDPATLHSLEELQHLFDEWVAVVWQNRRHRGLRDPLNPSVVLTPNEMHYVLSGLMPQAEVPFGTDTYIRLLPVEWRTVQPYGVSIGNRVYDSAALRPLRGVKSTLPGHGGRWPVHVDPHNVQTVWLRTGDGLLPLRWSDAEYTGPMSAEVYALARTPQFHKGRAAAQAETAARAREILDRAAAGSGSRAERIAAARSETVNADPMRLSAAPASRAPEHEEDHGEVEQPRARRLEILGVDEQPEDGRG